MSIKVGVVGCLGRMGRSLVSELLSGSYNAVLSSAASSPNSQGIGQDIGKFFNGINIGVNITSSIEEVFRNSNVVLEFSTPDNMLKCLDMAVKTNTPLVSGTTGFQDIDFTKYSTKIPLLWSANMSMGINLLTKLVEDAARILKDRYDIEIWEMHHNAKKDSPSGSAIMLGKSVAKGLESNFDIQQYLYGENHERISKSIGFSVSRGGGIIGEHNVMFINSEEKIEFKHTAITRNLFSKGAINSALWLYNKPPGLYSMFDIFS